MPELSPDSAISESTEQRDRMLRRLIATFAFASAVCFCAAVGMSVWNAEAVRVELAQQETSSPATSR